MRRRRNDNDICRFSIEAFGRLAPAYRRRAEYAACLQRQFVVLTDIAERQRALLCASGFCRSSTECQAGDSPLDEICRFSCDVVGTAMRRFMKSAGFFMRRRQNGDAPLNDRRFSSVVGTAMKSASFQLKPVVRLAPAYRRRAENAARLQRQFVVLTDIARAPARSSVCFRFSILRMNAMHAIRQCMKSAGFHATSSDGDAPLDEIFRFSYEAGAAMKSARFQLKPVVRFAPAYRRRTENAACLQRQFVVPTDIARTPAPSSVYLVWRMSRRSSRDSSCTPRGRAAMLLTLVRCKTLLAERGHPSRRQKKR